MAQQNNNTTAVVVLSVVVVILLMLLFIAPFGGGWGGLCGMMGGYAYGASGYGAPSYGYGMMGGFGLLVMVLIVEALVLFIIWLINQLQQGQRHTTTKHRRTR